MEKVKNDGKTFGLCVFFDYEVEYVCKYCYLNEDRDFVNKEIKHSYTIDGGRLLETIAKLILSNECIEFLVLENQIQISHFDPNSGETSDYFYAIKELGNVFEKKEKK